MERHEGDLELVARALHVAPADLLERLSGDAWLRGRWIEKTVNTTDRPPLDLPIEVAEDFLPPVEGLSPGNVKLAESVAAQDRKLRALDWPALGIKDPEQIRLLGEFEKFVGGKIVSTIDATHGGMLFAFAKTAHVFNRLNEALDAMPVDSETGLALVEAVNNTAHLLAKLNDTATKAANIRVLMESKAREVQAKQRMKKPGFAKPRNVTATGSQPEKVVTFTP